MSLAGKRDAGTRAVALPETPSPVRVDVWRVQVNLRDAELDARFARLDSSERDRASRFASAAARARYVGAHGVLREILGEYLGVPPEQLTFRQNDYGKPALSGVFAKSDLRFNLSHAGDAALYAVSRGREVGVDIEECIAGRATAGIGARFFSPAERMALEALPASRRTDAFYATWTRKEAFIKARGTGLSMPLDGFTVSVSADEPARLLSADRPCEIERWSMTALPVRQGFQATLVVEGTGWTWNCDEWHT